MEGDCSHKGYRNKKSMDASGESMIDEITHVINLLGLTQITSPSASRLTTTFLNALLLC